MIVDRKLTEQEITEQDLSGFARWLFHGEPWRTEDRKRRTLKSMFIPRQTSGGSAHG